MRFWFFRGKVRSAFFVRYVRTNQLCINISNIITSIGFDSRNCIKLK